MYHICLMRLLFFLCSPSMRGHWYSIIFISTANPIKGHQWIHQKYQILFVYAEPDISHFSLELQNNKKEDLGTITGGHGALSENWWTVSFCCHHVFVFLVIVPKNWQTGRSLFVWFFHKEKKKRKVSRQRGCLAVSFYVDFLLRSYCSATSTSVDTTGHLMTESGYERYSRLISKSTNPWAHCWRLTVSHSFY